MAAIKICGITDQAGLQTALTLKVERIGLMFAKNSPRYLSLELAETLAKQARGKTKIVAVFVNPGDKLLRRVVETVRPDFLQLHGKEAPKRVRSVWKQFHIPIIKACAVSSIGDINDADRYATSAAEFLFDTRPGAGSSREGGLGQAFDWSFLKGKSPARPYLLAGGLNAKNVGTALAVTGAEMVDVSSGVESSVGVKDPVLMQEFCEAVRKQQ